MLLTKRSQDSFRFLQQRLGVKIPLVTTLNLCGRTRKNLSKCHIHHAFIGQWQSHIFCLRSFSYSSTTAFADKRHRQLEVKEFLSSSIGNERQEIVHKLQSDDTSNSWKVVKEITNQENDKDGIHKQIQALPKKIASLLLPENYPHSVAEGYFPFVSYCFVASIAGSAAMVLSTQTLLLAVGIVGQNSTNAGVMAGALNWVMKDFMGQLGGIVFASKMGKTKAFDNDPKRWRMVAATALDGATLLEILSPLCHANMVLPVASIANIGKNIGFLTASASRASLHQSLAISGNLGDVTVKAGSQSMVASLAGTSLGIGLSTILDHEVLNFGICFVALSAIHQGCTYASLQNVPLAHFNRHRFHLAMEYYIVHGKAPSPTEIAKVEGFVPIFSTDSSTSWLRIGKPLSEVCSTPCELEDCLALVPNEKYLVQFNQNTKFVDLIFFHSANDEDLCRGMYHACLIQKEMSPDGNCLFQDIIRETYMQVDQNFSNLFEELQTQGWDISSRIDVEDEKARRIQIHKS